MKELFDAIQNSRHKKLIILLLIVFILAVNLIEPCFILNKGYFGEDFLILSTLVGLVTLFCVMFILLLIVKDNFLGCIILCCLPIIALFVSRNLSVPINKIAKKILWAETYAEVTEVKMKKQKKWRFKHHSEDVYYLYVNSKATCNKPIVIGKDIYDSINKGDTIIINISKRNHNIWRTRDLHPTSEDIEKCKNEMSLYIDEAKSYIMLATVISKESREENRKHSQLYYAKLRIRDGLVTSLLRIRDPFQNDRQVYESLREGDTVLVKLTEAAKKSVSVIKWQPTSEDKQKYKTPVKVIERK